MVVCFARLPPDHTLLATAKKERHVLFVCVLSSNCLFRNPQVRLVHRARSFRERVFLDGPEHARLALRLPHPSRRLERFQPRGPIAARRHLVVVPADALADDRHADVCSDADPDAVAGAHLRADLIPDTRADVVACIRTHRIVAARARAARAIGMGVRRDARHRAALQRHLGGDDGRSRGAAALPRRRP